MVSRILKNRVSFCPFQDYTHFYGQGGDPLPGKCPLWSQNDELHRADVQKGAKAAKDRMDRERPEVELKFDPTEDVRGPFKVAILNYKPLSIEFENRLRSGLDLLLNDDQGLFLVDNEIRKIYNPNNALRKTICGTPLYLAP